MGTSSRRPRAVRSATQLHDPPFQARDASCGLPASLRFHDLRHTSASLLIGLERTRSRSRTGSGTPRSSSRSTAMATCSRATTNCFATGSRGCTQHRLCHVRVTNRRRGSWRRQEPDRPLTCSFLGADDGIRTRDPNLGKVVLYQLSHVRVGDEDSAPRRAGLRSRRGGPRPARTARTGRRRTRRTRRPTPPGGARGCRTPRRPSRRAPRPTTSASLGSTPNAGAMASASACGVVGDRGDEVADLQLEVVEALPRAFPDPPDLAHGRVAERVACRLGADLAGRRIGLMPTMSASRPASRSTFGPPPPTTIGGRGCCSGLGSPSYAVIV